MSVLENDPISDPLDRPLTVARVEAVVKHIENIVAVATVMDS